ncbi:MAG: YbgC/FadM family acyl-CoA thioesterase [Nitrospira sp.]|nr:YbgC/FadM family acyl-CoA thioesterase [Nitrospira sp.]
MEIKVYYEDTDCGGVVYYANYLKYFERARTEYLEMRGCSIADWMQRGVIFVVVHAEAHYYSAGRYGETLTIETDVADVTQATVTFSHVVREKVEQSNCCEGVGSSRSHRPSWESTAPR